MRRERQRTKRERRKDEFELFWEMDEATSHSNSPSIHSSRFTYVPSYLLAG
jgi:hypothetical protein